jgi:PAS domain S-box-containing protein
LGIQSEDPDRHRVDRIRRHQAAIVTLATDSSLAAGDFAAWATVATEAASAAIDVDRASVWLLGESGRELRCVDLFERSRASHTADIVLTADSYPAYFRCQSAERVIDAHDARTDPRTSEFAEHYLEPLGIMSMLDAAVRVAGRFVGVVCHEHVGGARRWTDDEAAFAGQFADQVAQALLSQERRRAEEALRQSEEKYSRMFDACPVMMSLQSLKDRRYLEVNRAHDLHTGYGREEKIGRSPLDLSLWDDPRQLDFACQKLISDGSYRNLVIGYHTKSGEPRVARLSAEVIVLSGERCYLTVAEDITDRQQAAKEREELIAKLQQALAEVTTLSGIIPICAGCKKIRDDKGFWNQVESYIQRHSLAQFSHGLCPECVAKFDSAEAKKP